MPGPLIFVGTNRLKEGALEAERRRVPELVEFVEREELPDAVADALREQAGEGVDIAIHSELLGGFLRS